MRLVNWTSMAGCAAIGVVLFISCAWLARSAGMQDAHWLGEHANKDGRYYEGLLDQPNAKQEYQVLGFFAYGTSERPRMDRDPAEGSVLQAWFYVPRKYEEIGNHPVVVRAKQIASRTNYLLQSKPEGIRLEKTGWSYFPWSTDPYIRKYHINPNNLGVVARLDDPADVHLFPVVLSLSCQSESINHYDLILKIQRYSLSDLSYDVGPMDGGSPVHRESCFFTSSDPCSHQRQKASPIEAGTVLELPFVVDSAKAGWRSLHVSGRYKDSSDGIDLTYKFFHQPLFECE